MASTILQSTGAYASDFDPSEGAVDASETAAVDKNPFLVTLGQRVRALRTHCGMTRKALARAAGVSERHLASLEHGVGNASVLVLLQVAGALQCSLSELIGEATAPAPEWLLIRELLQHRDEATLRRVRLLIGDLLATGAAMDGGQTRIALIGLRGAGKSTLGRMLAEDLGFAFVELSREVERVAGCSVAEIHALYGVNAYRRYERRALQEAIRLYPSAVIATPGGLVSDAATFELLLSQCTTVWLQARPQDHMDRVTAQGDLRPMAASREAMQDLKAILVARAALYSKAHYQLDTSAAALAPTFAALRHMLRAALQLSA